MDVLMEEEYKGIIKVSLNDHKFKCALKAQLINAMGYQIFENIVKLLNQEPRQ